MRWMLLHCILAGGLLGMVSPAGAKVTLECDAGWGGMYRAGRWTPVFITVTDDSVPTARNILIEMNLPHSHSFGLRLHQMATAAGKPSTYVLYAPLPRELYNAAAVIRDLRTGRKLAEVVLDPNVNPASRGGPNWYAATRLSDLIIGVSGPRPAMEMAGGTYRPARTIVVEDNPNSPRVKDDIVVKVGFLPPAFLPDVAQGYDTLDLLVLNGPDFGALPLPAQQAIAQWVERGGRLLMWLGDSPLPPESPVLKLLPCKVGDRRSLALGAEKPAGVGSRLPSIPGRQLSPLPGARTMVLLKEGGSLLHRRAGLGEVAIIDFDASQLTFESEKSAQAFWGPVLWRLVRDPTKLPNESADGNWVSYAYATLDDAARAAAVEEVVERLGDVPGVGTFNFSYIAAVVLGLMVVVGPCDWFVLKKLGRQPWTWATVSGWVVLITVGALFLGRAFRSGDLHFRTVRVIDQADGRVVAAMDVAGLYSPRTREYSLDCPRGSWWQPMSLDTPYQWRQQRRFPPEIVLQQDRRGNVPLPMGVSIWHLRFMQADCEDTRDLGAAVVADLRLAGEAGQQRIVGTITNRSKASLTHLVVRTGRGVAILRTPELKKEPVQPGETIEVDERINPAPQAMQMPKLDSGVYYESGSAYRHHTVMPQISFLRAACDLRPEASRRVEELLAADEQLACIYAEGPADPATVRLAEPEDSAALKKHWQVIRALTPLGAVGQ